MTSPLRQLLADGIAARQAEAAAFAALVPQGAFTHLGAIDQIHFATIGRNTGRRHAKYWFPWAPWGDTLYNLEEKGEAADWVKNLRANPAVEIWVKPADPIMRATARFDLTDDEETFARALLAARIADLGVAWELRHALVVAFDATPPPNL